MNGINISDEVHIYVTMSPLLISCTKRLLNKVENAHDDVEGSCMAMATIVMSLTAIDAFLTDYAHNIKPEIYSNNFVNKNIPNKFKKLFDKEFKDSFPEVEELRKYRVDIIHGKPHSERARQLGVVTNIDGAHWATETCEKFVSIILGNPHAKLSNKWSFILNKNYIDNLDINYDFI